MENSYKHNKELLLDNIQNKIGKPVSVDTVVAIIESFGIRDKDVVDDYGEADIHTLAYEVFILLNTSKTEIKNEKELEELENAKPENNSKLYKAMLFLKHYLSASSYLLAIVVQLITIVLFGFALYVFTKFNQQQSTAVVLGIILGMILSGGFIKVIGKEISTYYYSNDFSMVKQITFFLLKKGTLFMIIALSCIYLINTLFLFFPMSMMLITSIYALLVGVLFLVFAPLHTLKSRLVILVSTLVATVFGVVLLLNSSINIYLIHFISLAIAIAITVGYLLFYFNRKGVKKIQQKKYKLGAILFNNYSYFWYGILINFFFFIDRILAWSTTNISNKFFPIYYEKDYEIGMDIAILFFLLLVSSLEYSGVSFVKQLNKLQNSTSILQTNDYSDSIKKLYKKSTLLLFITAIPVLCIVEYFMYGKLGYNNFFSIPLNGLNIKIAQFGIVSYFFLCWGFLNALYLITLRQEKKVLRFIVIACLVNLLVGFVLSRFFSYEYSIFGLFAGSITFTLLGLKENIKVFKNIDYYYYAAY